MRSSSSSSDSREAPADGSLCMRFLFHCRNSTGLGHLVRGNNIAVAIRQLAPSAEILFTGDIYEGYGPGAFSMAVGATYREQWFWQAGLPVDLMRYGHAMSIPVPGVRGNAALRALRETTGRVRFAHSDLSGYSVFEEAMFHGTAAAGP